jgi:hypothetical protein
MGVCFVSLSLVLITIPDDEGAVKKRVGSILDEVFRAESCRQVFSKTGRMVLSAV